MEVIMSNYWLFALIVVFALFLGFIIGRLTIKKHHDGWIIIEPTKEKDRDRLIWKLDMELDDIRKKPEIIFRVADNTSKKSQSV